MCLFLILVFLFFWYFDVELKYFLSIWLFVLIVCLGDFLCFVNKKLIIIMDVLNLIDFVMLLWVWMLLLVIIGFLVILL